MKTTEQMAKELGIPLRTLQEWTKAGILTPEQVPAPGMPYIWSLKDQREARTVKQLRDSGVPLQKVRKARAYLQELGFNPFSTGQVAVVLGKKGEPEDIIKIVDETTAFQLLRERGQLTMFAPFADEDERPDDANDEEVS